MSANKIFVLLSVATIAVCGHVQQISANEFTIDEFTGAWYELGLIYAAYDPKVPLTCNWFNIIKQHDDDQSFKEDYRFIGNGRQMKLEGKGKIINSDIQVSFPDYDENYTYIITKYNNGREIIFRSADESIYGVISRSQHLSVQVKAEFDEIGVRKGIRPVYYNQEDCPKN